MVWLEIFIRLLWEMGLTPMEMVRESFNEVALGNGSVERGLNWP